MFDTIKRLDLVLGCFGCEKEVAIPFNPNEMDGLAKNTPLIISRALSEILSSGFLMTDEGIICIDCFGKKSISEKKPPSKNCVKPHCPNTKH